jgi:hypothetical protein
VTISFYDTLTHLGSSVGHGPIHRRLMTLEELTSGHRSVLEQLRLEPGRWALIVEATPAMSPTCCEYPGGRFLQFMALEDGISLIGECGSNEFLDEDHQFTLEQQSALIDLGWNDPMPSQTPNWFSEARTGAELDALDALTSGTLRRVFGLHDRDLLEVSLNEVIVNANDIPSSRTDSVGLNSRR